MKVFADILLMYSWPVTNMIVAKTRASTALAS
jgi:hypothetical protein